MKELYRVIIFYNEILLNFSSFIFDCLNIKKKETELFFIMSVQNTLGYSLGPYFPIQTQILNEGLLTG